MCVCVRERRGKQKSDKKRVMGKCWTRPRRAEHESSSRLQGAQYECQSTPCPSLSSPTRDILASLGAVPLRNDDSMVLLHKTKFWDPPHQELTYVERAWLIIVNLICRDACDVLFEFATRWPFSEAEDSQFHRVIDSINGAFKGMVRKQTSFLYCETLSHFFLLFSSGKS